MRATRLFKDFFRSEKAGGIILIIATIFSLVITNSSFVSSYIEFWKTPVFHHELSHWINDGLMAIYFLLIGLELEREVYIGELSNLKEAALPIFGALGGMLIPAGIFLVLNFGLPTQSGAGIPMATDIAFALGILSLLGNRVPYGLKVFLTALAVIDDLGAILVIAIFYTKTLQFTNLAIALGIFGLLLLFNRLKIRNLIPYLIGGVFMWYFFLNSGVHATISGVLLAFAIPFGNGNKNSTSFILQHFLHKPSAYAILPIFALANTCIMISTDSLSFFNEYSIGIILGLVVGKPIGISLFSYFAVRMKWCSLPDKTNWKQLIGVSILGGIGFTMSIFIALLAFSDEKIINQAKLDILLASLTAGILGYFLLNKSLKN